MATLGKEHHPIIVKVNSEERATRVAEICEEYGFKYIVGLEYDEDLTDLKKAIQERKTPANVYDPCPCGSGKNSNFAVLKSPSRLNFSQSIHFSSIWGELNSLA